MSWGALLYQKGRELLPEGIVYYSEQTHYSVSKVLRVLALRNIMIKTLANGEIDYEDLRETVRIHRDVPPIILANIGTTMKGAVDNVDTIQGVLRDFALPNFYIHCDAALSGMILPFVKDPEPYGFAAGIDSMSRRAPPWRRAAPPAPRATWPQKHHHDDALREVSPRLHRRGRLLRPGRQNVRICCSG